MASFIEWIFLFRLAENILFQVLSERPGTDSQGQEDRFCMLPTDQQLAILRNKMKYFQNFIAPGEYCRFLQEFRASLRFRSLPVQCTSNYFHLFLSSDDFLFCYFFCGNHSCGHRRSVLRGGNVKVKSKLFRQRQAPLQLLY